jgi:DNA-binding transcriptional ArsR family regulator
MENALANADFVLAPKFVSVSFDLAPVVNIINSLSSLLKTERFTGLGEWITQTTASLSPEMKHQHRLVFEGFKFLFHEIHVAQQDWPDFPSFIDHLAAQDPVKLRDQALEKRCCCPPENSAEAQITPAQALGDLKTFIRLVASFEPDEEPDEPFLAEVHALLNDPPAMHKLVISHLRLMWHDVMRPEWERVLPLLKQTISAFQQMDFSHVTIQEALRIVTGREMPAPWEDKLTGVDRITFIPTAHIGPYIALIDDDHDISLLFGAHLPRQVASSTLSRSELLVRLNALADDTRLRILELLTQEDEVCAQDLITRLDLSQSSVSRHLSTLVSTSFVNERRRDVAKCYSLNPRRVEDTLHALTNFFKNK